MLPHLLTPEKKGLLLLHRGQMEVFRWQSRFKVVVAGRRWGKTRLARTVIIAKAKKPKQLIWYVAPTYRMAKQIMWTDLLDAIPRRWIRKINETTMTIRLVNGTVIELKGADKPDTLRGVGINYLVLDEYQDMRPETWLAVLRPTLASTRGEAMFIGTPKAFNCLYEVYVKGQNPTLRDKRIWASWQFPTMTSPFIPPEEIEAAREDMDEKTFNQEFNASFETMSGRVYHAFNRFRHVGDHAFNPNLPIWIGQDFNIDPMSSVILQPQDDGEVWAVDEIVLYGSNTQEVCDEIERRYWRHMDKIVVYPDPAGQNRNQGRGESNHDIFREKGMPRIKFRRKHPAVVDRVNAVNRMFLSASGVVRMRVNKSCKHLVNSLEQTIYKAGTPEIDKKLGTEHSADALGYPIELQFPLRKIKVGGRSI